MSMTLTLVKVPAATHGKIIETKGQHLTALLRGEAGDDGFDRKQDVASELDYRDLSFRPRTRSIRSFSCFRERPSSRVMNGPMDRQPGSTPRRRDRSTRPSSITTTAGPSRTSPNSSPKQ